MAPLWGGFCLPWHLSPTSNGWQHDRTLPSPQKNQYAFEICSNMRYGEDKTSWFIAREDRCLQWKYHRSWPEGLAVLSKQDRDETAKRHGRDALLVGLNTQGFMKKTFSQDHTHLNENNMGIYCICDPCWQNEQWANDQKWVLVIFTFFIKKNL